MAARVSGGRKCASIAAGEPFAIVRSIPMKFGDATMRRCSPQG